MKANGQYLLEPEAVKRLADYGIPYPEHGLAHSASEAVQIARELGGSVVLKVVSPQVPHKSDVGGVMAALSGDHQVREGYGRLVERIGKAVPKASLSGVLVCKQAPPGLELIVGALNDLTFGPTVMFGLGGIFTEVLHDVSFRVAPLRQRDAVEMVREIRGYPLLQGERGRAPLDLEALTELLISVSSFVSERGDVEELDLNPVRLYERGLLALDARLTLRQR